MMRTGNAFLALCFALSLQACSGSSEKLAPDAGTAATDKVASSAKDIVLAEQSERVGRGEAIAETACAGCHAFGAADESPHPVAPPLRLLSQTVDLGMLEARFEDGTISDHPDMPDWQFEQIDAASLVAYLKSVQSDRAD